MEQSFQTQRPKWSSFLEHDDLDNFRDFVSSVNTALAIASTIHIYAAGIQRRELGGRVLKECMLTKYKSNVDN
jgi:hypothetical protein